MQDKSSKDLEDFKLGLSNAFLTCKYEIIKLHKIIEVIINSDEKLKEKMIKDLDKIGDEVFEQLKEENPRLEIKRFKQLWKKNKR